MTTYLSSYDRAAHKETIYTVDINTGISTEAGSYAIVRPNIDYGTSFIPGFDGIAINSSDTLFVLGDYFVEGYLPLQINTLPILSFAPSISVNNFSKNNSINRLGSIFRSYAKPTPPNNTNSFSSFSLGNEPALQTFSGLSSVGNTTKNILTFGDGNLYMFSPGIKTTNEGTKDGAPPITYINELLKIDPGKISSATPLAQLPFAINALAYDPNLENNPKIKHRLFATAPGSNGDQLYSINLDKIGQADGIEKIGDRGIGYANINGLVFEEGALIGYTSTGQYIVIDTITGQGVDIPDEAVVVQGQITGAAASQVPFNLENQGYLVDKQIPNVGGAGFFNYLSYSASPLIPKALQTQQLYDAQNNGLRAVTVNLAHSGGASTTAKYGGENVWILTHGWDSDPSRFKTLNEDIGLKEAIEKQHPNDVVLLVDWSDAAGDNNPVSPGDDVTQWIKEVADYTYNQLKNWGLTDPKKVNLIGHSLGTFVSSELGLDYLNDTKNPTAGKVATFTALEPASSATENLPYPLNIFSSYNLSSSSTGAPLLQSSDLDFSSFADFSRVFEGTTSSASSANLAKTANEAILINFGNTALTSLDGVTTIAASAAVGALAGAPLAAGGAIPGAIGGAVGALIAKLGANTAEHNDVVKVFANIVDQGGLNNSQLSKPLFSLDDSKINTQFKPKTFTKDDQTVFSGIITADKDNQPTSFEAISQATGKTEVYGVKNSTGVATIPVPLTQDGKPETVVLGSEGDTIVLLPPIILSGSPTAPTTPLPPIEIIGFTPGQDTIDIIDPNLNSSPDGSIGSGDLAVVDSIDSSNPLYSSGSSASEIIFSQSTGQLYFNSSHTGVKATPFAKLDGVKSIGKPDVKVNVVPALLSTPNDFNGDAKSDILWQNTNGSIAQWQMNGLTATAKAVGALTPGWSIAGTGDFNSDAKSDILFQNTNGTVATWLMNGSTVTSTSVLGTLTPGWSIAGTGDFYGTGTSDVLLANTDGTVAEWQIKNATVTAAQTIGTLGAGWSIAGTGDFNGDGKVDILLKNTDGRIAEWQMNGSTVTTAAVIGTNTSDWKIAGIGDFNHDGKSDILFRNTNGSVAEWQMNGSTVASTAVIGTATADWKIAGTGVNSLGQADILWNNTNGTVAEWLLNGNKVLATGATSLSATTGWSIAAPIL
jgi:pimeloyl-ACP methyl ester carboxylesterase